MWLHSQKQTECRALQSLSCPATGQGGFGVTEQSMWLPCLTELGFWGGEMHAHPLCCLWECPRLWDQGLKEACLHP
jgi:hypothetical protein